MAINFPNSPANGDIFGNFTYDTSIPGWRKTPENSASLPAGTIVQWPGATAPANWLIADGSAVSRTTYASLFAAIGVQYGSGDGSTTFNLPNLKGRVAVGLDSAQTEFDTLGETGGAKTHTLTSAEMPSHVHTGSATTGSSGAHSHTVTVGGGAHSHQIALGLNAASGAGDIPYRSGSSGNTDTNFRTGLEASSATYGSSMGTHTHTTSVSTDGAHTHSVSFTTDSAGTGGAHNNLQPYIVLNYIIKTSAGITSGDSELATRVGVVEAQNNATPLSQNYIINGGFDFWQRGASLATSGYLADRFTLAGVSGFTQTRQAFTPGAAPVADYEGQYYWNVTMTSSNQNGEFLQRIEDARTLAGRTVTLSFWARSTAGAQALNCNIYQYFGTGGAPSSLVAATGGGTYTPTSSWQRYSFTFTVPSIAGKTFGTNNDSYLWARIGQFTATTANTSLDIWGVQLEEGSVATRFRRNSPSIQAELAACQRYYQRYVGGAGCGWFGAANSSTGILGSFNLPVVMRVPPAVSASGSIWVSDQYLTDQQATSASIGALQATNTNSGRIVVSGFSGLTTGRWYSAPAASLGSGYIDFSAEL